MSALSMQKQLSDALLTIAQQPYQRYTKNVGVLPVAELEVWLEAASQWQTITSHSNSSTTNISSVEIWYRSLEFCCTNMLDQGNHHPRDAFSRLVVYLEKDDISQDDLNEMLYRVATAKKYLGEKKRNQKEKKRNAIYQYRQFFLRS